MNECLWMCVLLLPVFFSCVTSETNLNGEWMLHNWNKSIMVPITIPGSVHAALRSKGIIGDPYFRFNDLEYRWIVYTDWTFSRTFNYVGDIHSQLSVYLVCDGLDTVASISMNGQQVGKSNNMFLRYIYDIKKYLKSGENTISIQFESAVNYAKRQAAKHTQYSVPPECNPPDYHGFCHPNFIRKEQCSFSWDWGPAFAPTGIWRNISIEVFEAAVLRDVVAIPILSTNPLNVPWSLNLTAYLETSATDTKYPIEGSIHVSLPELGVLKKSIVKYEPGTQLAHSIIFEVPMAESWWPIGYGKQVLYTVCVEFISSSGESSLKNVTVGFRKVTLVQDALPNGGGNTFYFKINERYIFLKGANWIPVDSFQERVTSERLQNLFQSAIDANMNTLRVWGGGIYEQEEFYQLADERGVMIWQDVMFACAMYPAGEEFLSSVDKEVEYQVRRLSNHPSIVAWGANNENEGALRYNWYGTSSNFSLYKADYIKLYIDTVRYRYLQQVNHVPILSSSPSNGIQTEEEGWVAKNPKDPRYGDVHFYDYQGDCWNVSIYTKPRFASEYGYQSLPSFATMAQVSNQSDWSFNSNFSRHRQHHPNGNLQMLASIQKHFSLPESNSSVEDYKNLIYLTQISQALCIKIETEHYRRHQSDLDKNNEGMTRGALYWQLNDIWQAPTWASIEYGGKWKMLHYYAKDFFEPVLASGFEIDDQLQVYVISDLTATLHNATLVVKVWSWGHMEPVFTQNHTFTLQPQSSASIFSTKMTEILDLGRCKSRHYCFFTFEVVAKNRTTPTNPLFISSFFDVEGLHKPKLQIINISQRDSRSFVIEIASEFISPFIWLDAADIPGRFSHNGFIQLQLKTSVEFYAWHDISLETFKQALTIRSLNSEVIRVPTSASFIDKIKLILKHFLSFTTNLSLSDIIYHVQIIIQN